MAGGIIQKFVQLVTGIILFSVLLPRYGFAGGVTIITHGYNSDVDSWVAGMADRIPKYGLFPGTNFTTYKLSLLYDGLNYYYQWSRTNGNPPSLTDSGEIMVKLDWSQVAGGLAPYNRSTYEVATVAAWAFLQTNLISELEGHALAEFPLHLIGHSRGGSLFSEVSRHLGTNGIWVDHFTTLDPHPLNNDGFSDPSFVVDASVKTYLNVLFHDNYWQNIGLGGFWGDPNGEPVAGAYVRQLYDTSGGYSGLSGSHSDVHLWYHGTLDWRTNASDTEKSISSTERQNWWVAYEDQGFSAGFLYSLIGGGDRTSADRPVGLGYPAIRDGYNQWWDLGAGTSNNRTTLPANNGNWPNLLKFNRTTTNQVVQGGIMPVTFCYQWAKSNAELATLSLYLDDDLNPLSTNQTLLAQIPLPGTGASFVGVASTNLTLSASNATPGWHTVLGKITGGGRTRFLYAPEWVQVVPSRQPPVLDIARVNATQYRIGVNGLPGQTVMVQCSTNLQAWADLATNTLVTNRWEHVDVSPGEPGTRYYRGVLR